MSCYRCGGIGCAACWNYDVPGQESGPYGSATGGSEVWGCLKAIGFTIGVIFWIVVFVKHSSWIQDGPIGDFYHYIRHHVNAPTQSN